MIKKVILIGCFLSPAVAWIAHKPVRLFAPQWVSGITCKSPTICIDDTSRYAQALELYNKASQYINLSVGKIKNKPRIVFCSTMSCFKSFGFNRAAAQTVGQLGIIISPRGWKYYYIRHEMIHHLQAEKMGTYSQWRSPAWFTEGMAYFLSQDPRETLAMPNQQHRIEFSKWYRLVGKENLWEAARNKQNL
ncbi:hypothetical protein MNBD_GAMMA12-2662 [hydrothermal vent metagenome]|uniref:Uncharacterized protein n=1 Tax=hydrothermal vent metagenome TaxID=652676 RepID=A0A3B0Y5F4_9ZZZZ